MSRDLLQPHTVRIFVPTVDLQWQRATLSEQLVDDPFKDYRSAERPLPANAGHEFADSGEKGDPIKDEPATLVVDLRAFLREKPSGRPSPTAHSCVLHASLLEVPRAKVAPDDCLKFLSE